MSIIIVEQNARHSLKRADRAMFWKGSHCLSSNAVKLRDKEHVKKQ